MADVEYELIIAEKDQQAEILAGALKIPEQTLEIPIPTKAFWDLEVKVRKMRKKWKLCKQKVDEVAAEYPEGGKDYTQLKRYQVPLERAEAARARFEEGDAQLRALEAKLETKRMTFWMDDHRILVSCMGHLIDVGLRRSQEDPISFVTRYVAPTPFSRGRRGKGKDEKGGAKVIKYLKYRLIQILCEKYNIQKFICATDYDREGQSIYGTLIEFLGYDVSQTARMKFSTLEDSVLQAAYQNPLPFDENLFNAGKARRWLDLVIGFNVNPFFSSIYREAMGEYLLNLGLSEENIKTAIGSNSFNMGRVKLVIMDYIYKHTHNQLDQVSEVENHELSVEETTKYKLNFLDDDGREVFLQETDSPAFKRSGIDPEQPIDVEIVSVEEEEIEKSIGYAEVPTLLNMTKTFQICADLKASMEEVNRILEYLYLRKYISYPRSKSERWEIDSEEDKKKYAGSVLKALENCGYPVKEEYYEGWGKEGDESHSHPAIHPLPSLDKTRVDRLKKVNPLAYLVLHQICLNTLMAFEKLPIVKQQKISYLLKQGEKTLSLVGNYVTEIVQTNILDFKGLWGNYVQKEIEVQENESYPVISTKTVTVSSRLTQNSESPSMLSDFDIINFLNENDIGTDATRTNILSDLISLQYLVSPKVLLTTYLGNVLTELAHEYVDFINMTYTSEMERSLDRIEKGIMRVQAFEDRVKEVVSETYNHIEEHRADIKQVFQATPECEIHHVPMIISIGSYGKFFSCPHYYLEKGCNQRFSI